MGQKVPDPPPPPDPYKTANAQTQSNISTATANTYLGNANEISPFGTVTYTETGTKQVREANRDKDGNVIKKRVWVDDPNGNEWQAVGGGFGGGGGGTEGEMAATGPGGGNISYEGGGAGRRGRWEDQIDYNVYDIPTFLRETKLSPEQQALYDRQVAAQKGLLDLGNSQIQRLQSTLNSPFDISSAPARINSIDVGDLPMYRYGVDINGLPTLHTAVNRGNLNDAVTSIGALDDFAPERQRVEDALMARMNPSLDRERARMEAQLVNQGFTRGTEAFTSQMQDFGRQENDARMAAILAAGQEQNRLLEGRALAGNFSNNARSMLFGENATDTQIGNAARGQRFGEEQANVSMNNAARAQQVQERLELANFANAQREATIQEMALLRNQPLNEISALLGQTQVQAPQFQGYRPGVIQNTPVGDYVYKSAEIESKNWQAQAAAQAQAMGGMFSLGGSLLGGMFRLSDRRAKTDVRRIGTADNGLPIYLYRYVGGGPFEIGFMAQDVEKVTPEAVIERGGLKMVDYERAAA